MADSRLVRAALNAIGLEVVLQDEADGFLSDCRIENGRLLVAARCSISNILHEAGHLAILPARFRPWACDDLDVMTVRMLDAIADLDPDSPLYRAALQCGDAEATAWAFAFGTHLKIAPEEIIEDYQYEGTGEHVRLCLSMRAYLGINGLAHAGFCSTNRFGRLPVYPSLASWLQPA